ncbi:hypothetical protein [Sphingomonas turrisvirgatae]|uniref:EF-hand domain-containing protein n=1 Tax=Sphingomonas turrisvirgatae TaxID=1888892 RepID=A0A1E3LYM1_9SPHN|nr:hypothetical protein [Sphingomonas turrisvirgatae]ODP37900.1 hypothetical protein BFL28_16570 [Sphingomonas turrisvirgatae]
MTISRTKLAFGAALAVAAAVGVPALGQDGPESLLPPGFDDPVPAPAPTPRATQAPGQPAAPAPSAPSITPGLPLDSAPLPPASPTPVTSAIDKDGDGKTDPDVIARYELPDFAKRSLAQVGPASPASDGLPVTAFGAAHGKFLQTLMRRTNAPIASRWLSIALRRALLSRVDTPRGVNGADFAAERAWLLLRMGEADAARAMVQSVDVANYTPKLFQVGMQAMLATADPGGLCSMATPALKTAPDRNWRLAEAICAGLEGDPTRAGPLIDQARRRMGNEIDLLLAEKVVGMGVSGRRAVTIEWNGVDQISAWRWGLATASGTQVPDALYDTGGPQLRYWRATSPAIAPNERLAAAEAAAGQGVFSSQALTDLYGEIEDAEDSSRPEVAVARDLRTAFIAATGAERVTQMRQLWDAAQGAQARYARLILTARAAARLEPSADFAQDADRLIASMLSAGLDRSAMRWRSVAARGSDGWAMLLLADPAGGQVSASEVEAYGGSAEKGAMLAAAMAGMGRVTGANAPGGVDNAWTRAIALAAERRQPGTVVLLAAIGMQTQAWAGVSPTALYHITRALTRVGLDSYARMIAVEAMTRL